MYIIASANRAEDPILKRVQWIGFTWQASSALVPRLVTAMTYTNPASGLSGRITHPFWVLDYSRNHCGRVRVGSSHSSWRERSPAIAHLYPPGTAYWEDRRSVTGMMEGAYVVFAGGDEAGLRGCIPKGQFHARIADRNGLILDHLHAAASAGAEGAAGFWEAQTALCALIGILRRTVPGAQGVDLAIGSAVAGSPSEFVRTVNAFLAGRVGGRVSLAEIAEGVRVSPSTLSHRYAAEAGQPPLVAFNAMRLEAARSLILRGLKLEAVAAQTGFCDAYHLSKAFTCRFAVPPATYRRQIEAGKACVDVLRTVR